MFCEILPLCNFPASLPVSHSASPLLLHCCHSAFIRHARPQSGVNTANEIEIISGARTCWCKSVIGFCCFFYFLLFWLSREDCVSSVRELSKVSEEHFFLNLSFVFFLFRAASRPARNPELSGLSSPPLPHLSAGGAGRAGCKTVRLGPQPGPAGPVHRLAGEGADQNGQQHEEVPHRDPAPLRQVGASFLPFLFFAFVSLTLGTKVAEPPARGSVF